MDEAILIGEAGGSVSETVVVDNIGCYIVVVYDYHPITEQEIIGYKMANMPQPDQIYKTWDYRNRALLAASTNQIDYVRFEIEDAGGGVPVTAYQFDELINVLKVLDVTIEGQGVLESRVTINTVTGQLTITDVVVGQYVKVTYKK